VFSLTSRAGQDTRDVLAEYLHAKQLLLVLDNCEHLLEGAAALAGALARSCEQLAILATSREGLGIEGEHLLPVPPLGVPEVDASLVAITAAESVQLFTERAGAARPGFQVTEQNAAAVAAVVRRLDGIALAVELAAARVGAMTPPELARRLERGAARENGTRRCGPLSTGPSSCSPSPNRPCWPGWRCSPAVPPWRPPRRSAAGRASIWMRCSSCWRVW
jgi:predicted ATPase